MIFEDGENALFFFIFFSKETFEARFFLASSCGYFCFFHRVGFRSSISDFLTDFSAVLGLVVLVFADLADDFDFLVAICDLL